MNYKEKMKIDKSDMFILIGFITLSFLTIVYLFLTIYFSQIFLCDDYVLRRKGEIVLYRNNPIECKELK